MSEHVLPKGGGVVGKRGGQSRLKVASCIKFAREQNGLTQKQLGRLLNVSDVTVSAIERGVQRVDTVQLEKLAKIFGKTVRWFYGDDAGTSLIRPPDVLLTELQERIKNYISVYADFGIDAEVVDTVPVLDAIEVSSLKGYRIDGLTCEPMVWDGDILVVDTKGEVVSGVYVVVIHEGKAYCGLYNEENGERNVCNPRTILPYSACHLIGVLVQLTRKIR